MKHFCIKRFNYDEDTIERVENGSCPDEYEACEMCHCW
jgi:hypothetical protein